MNTSIILFAVLGIVAACTEAKYRCARVCRIDETTKIRCIREGVKCRKILQCTLDEMNCERNLRGLPAVNTINKALCRNIETPLGSGDCAFSRIPRSSPRDCNDIRCAVHTKILMCYRSKRNNCRLLTPCEMNIKNCKRGPNNRLEWIDSPACDGLKEGGRKQKCRAIV